MAGEGEFLDEGESPLFALFPRDRNVIQTVASWEMLDYSGETLKFRATYLRNPSLALKGQGGMIREERVWGTLEKTEGLSKWPLTEMLELRFYSAIAGAACAPPLPKEGHLWIPSWRNRSKRKRPTIWLLGSRLNHPAVKLTNCLGPSAPYTLRTSRLPNLVRMIPSLHLKLIS